MSVNTRPGSQVRNDVTYNCGCGFHTADPVEAEKHVEATRHVVDAHGVLRHAEGKK